MHSFYSARVIGFHNGIFVGPCLRWLIIMLSCHSSVELRNSMDVCKNIGSLGQKFGRTCDLEKSSLFSGRLMGINLPGIGNPTDIHGSWGT